MLIKPKPTRTSVDLEKKTDKSEKKSREPKKLSLNPGLNLNRKTAKSGKK